MRTHDATCRRTSAPVSNGWAYVSPCHGTRAWPRLVSVVRSFGRALAAGLDFGLGRRAVRPRFGLHRFAGFKRLVDLEEVLDLEPLGLGHVVDIAQVRHPRGPRRHAEGLVVGA